MTKIPSMWGANVVDSQFSLRRLRAQGSSLDFGGSGGPTMGQPALVKSQPAARPVARYTSGARAGSLPPRPIEDQPRASAADSFATIERALENINSLQESIGFYKEMVAELRTCLDEERRQRGDAHARIGSLEHLVAAERERALVADQRSALAEDTIAALRTQLETNQTETMRLVTAIQTLTNVRLDPPADVVDWKARRAA